MADLEIYDVIMSKVSFFLQCISQEITYRMWFPPDLFVVLSGSSAVPVFF